MNRQEFQQLIRSSSDFLKSHCLPNTRHAIILGTGAGDVASEIKPTAEIPYAEIPGFPTSTAMGHKGQWICGTLDDVPVVAMQGRFHLYEGYDVDLATLPIHTMHELGVDTLYVSNASGGLNPKFASGEIMLIDSHLDFMYRSTVNMFDQLAEGRPLIRSDAYDAGMIEQALECGRKNGFVVHRGVYAALLGPNYETRAEYRMLRRIGADVAGMSTVPEVTVAARFGIRVMGMSVITNVAKPDVLEETSGQEVIDAAAIAAPNLTKLIKSSL